MKKTSLLVVLAVALMAHSALALKSVGIGIRGGYVSGYDNPDLLTYSGAIDKLQMLGVHAQIGFLPVFDVDVSGEYAWQSEKNFMPGVDLTYGDLSVNGTVTYGLSMPVIKPYVGLGLGLHRLIYSWKGSTTSTLPDDQSRMSWHGLGGIALSIPAFPLTFFVEGRYTSLQTKPDKTNFTTLTGGVTFGL